MALVSYGASDDSDLSDEEEEVEKVTASAAVSAVKKTTPFESNGHISDEEDEFLGGGIIKTMQHQITYVCVPGDEDHFIPEKEEPDVFSLIAKKLPQVPNTPFQDQLKIKALNVSGTQSEEKGGGGGGDWAYPRKERLWRQGHCCHDFSSHLLVTY